jgi:hypothetical protein
MSSYRSSDPALKSFVVATCVAILFLTLQPLFSTGYTTADDVDGLTVAYKLFDVLDPRFAGGRLSYYFSVVFGYSRVLIDSFFYLKCFYVVPIAALILASSYVVALCTRSRNLALIYFCLICVAQQNNFQHHTLTAHPATIHVGYLIFLASIALFISGIRKDNQRYIFTSAALYGFSLITYEMFIPFVVIFPLIGYAFDNKLNFEKSKKSALWRLTEKLAAHIVLFSLVLGAYFLFRFLYPVTYTGALVTNEFSLSKFINTLEILSTSAIPPNYFYSTKNILIETKDSFEPFNLSFSYLISNYRPEWIIRATSMAVLVGFASARIKYWKVKPLRDLAIAIACVLMIYLPNILLALTPTKQAWVDSGIRTYTGTYFSLYPAMATWLIPGYLALNLSAKYSRIGQRTLSAVLAMTVAYLSYLGDYSNYYISKVQSEDYNMWRLMGEFVQSPTFDAIPENSFIYAPSLWRGGRFWPLFHQSPAMDDYWSRFVKIKTRRDVFFIRAWDKQVCEKIRAEKSGHFYQLNYSGSDSTANVTSAQVTLNSSCEDTHFKAGSMDGLLLSSKSNFSVIARIFPAGNPAAEPRKNSSDELPIGSLTYVNVSEIHRTKSKAAQFFTLKVSGQIIDLNSVRIIADKLY